MRRKFAAEISPERFLHISDAIERRLKQAVLLLTALLILSQAVMQVPSVRHWLSAADRLEGASFTQGSGR
jgi:hypothetical protein